MLCALGATAQGQDRTTRRDLIDLPLTSVLPPTLRSCAIDNDALSLRTGFQVRSPRAAERPWTVRIQGTDQQLTVSLHRPDGRPVTSKVLTTDASPCDAVLELVAVLLAAHVPEVVLGAPAAAAPASQPASASRPSVPRPRPEVSTVPAPAPDADRPTTLRASPAPARVLEGWYAGAGGGVSGFDGGAAVLGMLRAHARIWRYLAAGGQVLVSYSDHDVADGTTSVWTVDGRLMAGIALRRQRLAWLIGGLIGGRLTHGAASGLARDGSDSVGSLGLGLCGDMWWTAGRHLRIGIGTNVVFFVPRAAFDVTGVGEVYATPTPTVELHLSAGWGS